MSAIALTVNCRQSCFLSLLVHRDQLMCHWILGRLCILLIPIANTLGQHHSPQTCTDQSWRLQQTAATAKKATLAAQQRHVEDFDAWYIHAMRALLQLGLPPSGCADTLLAASGHGGQSRNHNNVGHALYGTCWRTAHMLLLPHTWC